uniref:Cytochrome c biogenesis protein n=1 Tax=Eustigmatophyceae sp. WTwin 8/9 T-6m6.8 TaxID=2974615 RepID=UPI00218246B3|nr:Cytochrome c biogenesis protein [Eustigmatophyceae sp. WTwin 8/9 T-6m6.8]UVI60980.1 Cytochrome c biogenesis protein [Eustigmatophyceae sp. WTwin 8/9 T-6m6.8]
MRTFIKWLSNIKFAIFILGILIFCSFIGSIVEQTDKPVIENINLTNQFPSSFSGVFSLLGFSNIFNNIWFFALNLTLGLSLISCTFSQQLPSFDFCRSLNFIKKFWEKEKFDSSLIFPPTWFPFVITRLSGTNYYLFQKMKTIYGCQGLAGRLGPVFVHLSLILILVASLLSALGGILAQEFIPKCEIAYLQNLPSDHIIENLPTYPIRVNDFWVSHINGLIHQFYTNISSLDKTGNESEVFTLSVNHPFIKNNIIWYQTDWDIIGLKCNVNNLLYQLPVTSISTSARRLWLTWLPTATNNGLTIFLESLRGDFLINSINFSSSYNELSQSLVSDSTANISIIDILSCTGLQVRGDPGELLLCLGFASLILSSFISYVSYSRIWIIKKLEKIQIGGLTNRAKLRFDLHLLNLFNSK